MTTDGYAPIVAQLRDVALVTVRSRSSPKGATSSTALAACLEASIAVLDGAPTGHHSGGAHRAAHARSAQARAALKPFWRAL